MSVTCVHLPLRAPPWDLSHLLTYFHGTCKTLFFNYACLSVRLVENYKDFRKTINVQEADTTKDRDNKYLLNAVEDLICIPYFIFLKAVLKNNI